MPDQPAAKTPAKSKQRYLVYGLAAAGGLVLYLLWRNYAGGGGGSASTSAGTGSAGAPGTDMGEVIQTVQGPPGKTGPRGKTGARGPAGPRGPAGGGGRKRKTKKATSGTGTGVTSLPARGGVTSGPPTRRPRGTHRLPNGRVVPWGVG